MSYKKPKNSDRYKKYTVIIGALMNFGEMNTEDVAVNTGMSHSTASKALRALYAMGLLNASRHCAAVLDISENKYVLNVCDSLARPVLSKTYRHDDRYFTDENLSFFLKNCALMLVNDKLNELPLHLIADDDFAVKYKNVHDSFNPVAPVLAKYFDLKKTTLSNRQSCIEHGVKNLAGYDRVLLFTVSRERILMSYVTADTDVSLTPVRNMDSRELVTSADVCKAASSLACAVGNTVSLLKADHIVFDCCEIFKHPDFLPVFTSVLEKFTDCGTSDLRITLMNYSLSLGGAVYACHRRHLSLIRAYED